MKKIVLVMAPVLSVFAAVGAPGQDAPAPPPPVKQARVVQEAAAVPAASLCPQISVQTPAPRNVRDGQTATFIVNVQGGDPKVTPQIIWSVNGGVIKEGQETKKIEVDTTGAGAYREVTADVWVGGYPGECQSQASAIVRVVPPASKADEFGELAPGNENERLAGMTSALSQSDDHLYIIAYAGRTSVRGHAAAALKRMRTQLLNGGFDATRLAVIDGGFREQPAYEFWIVPQGAEAPKATPTIDRREIVYPKVTPLPAKKVGKP